MALCTLLDPKLERQTALLTAALDIIAAVATFMSWSSFRRLLDTQIKLALLANKNAFKDNDNEKKDEHKKNKKEKTSTRDAELEGKMTIKIICRLLDSIHWPIEKLDAHFISSVNTFSRSAKDRVRTFSIFSLKGRIADNISKYPFYSISLIASNYYGFWKSFLIFRIIVSKTKQILITS